MYIWAGDVDFNKE